MADRTILSTFSYLWVGSQALQQLAMVPGNSSFHPSGAPQFPPPHLPCQRALEEQKSMSSWQRPGVAFGEWLSDGGDAMRTRRLSDSAPPQLPHPHCRGGSRRGMPSALLTWVRQVLNHSPAPRRGEEGVNAGAGPHPGGRGLELA